MKLLETAHGAWTFVVSPALPTPFNYVPLAFRLLAMMIAAPFVLFIALELVAYVITRTLHISMSNLRVPRSPPTALRELEDDEDIAAHLGASYPTPGPDTPTSQKQPFSRAFGAAVASSGATPAALLFIAFLVGLAATGFHVLVSRGNERTALALAEGLVKPTAVVLTAHPDDEAMFFAPTILNLLAAGWVVLPICVSTGDAEGLGGVRAAELVASYARLGVSHSLPIVLDNPSLPDSMGPEGHWDPQLVAELIGPFIRDWNATHLLTFDEGGVTQHPNHIALSAVYPYLADTPVHVLKLYSPSLATKFTGVMWAIFIAVRDALRREPGHHAAFVSTPAQYATALNAMTAHKSQLVWFRWLYVAFSRLMWVNQLIEE